MLFNVAVALMHARSMRSDDAGDVETPEFSQTTDIWGVPHQPRPR